MELKVDDVKKFKVINEELLNKLKEEVNKIKDGTEYSVMEEDFIFKFEGKTYSVEELEKDTIEDSGKYQNGGTTYQLVSFDTKVCSYPSNSSITERFNVTIYEKWSRSGSYYSDYYYTYYKPQIVLLEIQTVQEVVIPEHEEVKYVSVK